VGFGDAGCWASVGPGAEVIFLYRGARLDLRIGPVTSPPAYALLT
jgi:hypothetical protein